MSKTTDTVFQLLAHTGISIAYAREAELEREVYFDKVFSEMYTYPIQTTEDIWRVLNIVFHCGVFYAQTNDLETSNALLNYAIAICSENHLTYYSGPCSCTVGQKCPSCRRTSFCHSRIDTRCTCVCKNQQKSAVDQ